jgi:hypothetical protein
MAQKTIFAPVFDTSFESNVLKTFAHEKKMLDKFKVDQDKEINKMLDAVRAACIQSKQSKAEFTKGNAATNAVLSQVNGLFMRLAGKRRNELGEWTKVDSKNKPLPEFVSESSARSYGSAFWIAFDKGIPFQRDLNNKKSTGHKDSETDTKEKKPTTGKVETTDIPALHQTLSKALAQARMLNQGQFHAGLNDLIRETWPDFVETVLAKK